MLKEGTSPWGCGIREADARITWKRKEKTWLVVWEMSKVRQPLQEHGASLAPRSQASAGIPGSVWDVWSSLEPTGTAGTPWGVPVPGYALDLPEASFCP